MPQRSIAWPAGTPCWTDLTTTDPPAARDWYAARFGWRVEVGDDRTHGFATATIDGVAVCGVHGIASDGGAQWITYLASDDVDGTARAIAGAGGEVVFGPIDVPDAGRLLIARDPTGATFGAWQAGPSIGAGLANEPGSMIWNELLTDDVDSAQDFYAEVFGVGFTEIGDESFRFATMEVDRATVGGVGASTVHAGDPHWRLYFCAADVDEHIAGAIGAGATAVELAHDSPFGRWAYLADPQGARYAVVTPPEG